MRIHGKSGWALAAVGLLSIACAFGMGSRLFAADGTASSSECIKCHTDLDRMDSYGAASAAGAAAIAG